MDGARVVPFDRQTADLFADIENVRTDDEAAGRMQGRIGSGGGRPSLASRTPSGGTPGCSAS